MKKLLLSVLCLATVATVSAQSVTENKHGVRVDASGKGVPTTEVTVYAPSIVRITKYADGLESMPEKKSYSTILTPSDTPFTVKEVATTVSLTTGEMTVDIDKRTGIVCFFCFAENDCFARSSPRKRQSPGLSHF